MKFGFMVSRQHIPSIGFVYIADLVLHDYYYYRLSLTEKAEPLSNLQIQLMDITAQDVENWYNLGYLEMYHEPYNGCRGTGGQDYTYYYRTPITKSEPTFYPTYAEAHKQRKQFTDEQDTYNALPIVDKLLCDVHEPDRIKAKSILEKYDDALICYYQGRCCYTLRDRGERFDLYTSEVVTPMVMGRIKCCKCGKEDMYNPYAGYLALGYREGKNIGRRGNKYCKDCWEENK